MSDPIDTSARRVREVARLIADPRNSTAWNAEAAELLLEMLRERGEANAALIKCMEGRS